MRSKRKLIVAILLLSCVVVASILGVTAVFAANQAKASTNLNVTYTASTNVNATITVGYKISDFGTSVSGDYTSLDFNGSESLTIYPRNKQTSFEISPTDIEVYMKKWLVFRFYFNNLSTDTSNNLVLSPTITGSSNFTYYYGASNTESAISCSSSSSTPTVGGTSMTTNGSVIISANSAKYVYIVCKATDYTTDAKILSIVWNLNMNAN